VSNKIVIELSIEAARLSVEAASQAAS
jgi:hypothetical protein